MSPPSPTIDEGSNLKMASAYLLEILSQPGKVRARWELRIDRPSSAILNEAAVARVLAEYLWDTGERPDADKDLPRRLRDRVGRALDGTVLSGETLRWFIGAFELDARTAEHLTHLRTGAWRNNEWW